MTERPIRLVAISGSLRARSSNTALLRASTSLAPEGVEVALYDGIGGLPHFNPDVEESAPPRSVIELRSLFDGSDGVIISSPEYAHGVPGVLKNALDWLVGAGELVGKPVLLINASAYAKHAQASLLETLTVMSWRVAAPVTITLAGRKLDAEGIAADPEIGRALKEAIERFVQEIGNAK